MKSKILLATILLFSIFSAHAQKDIPKGSLLLGGDLSFSSNAIKDENGNKIVKARSLLISPSAALGIRNNLFIGLSLGYNFSKNMASSIFSNSPYDSTVSHGYNAAIFIRKYKPLKNNFYIFLQGSFGGGYSDKTINDVPGRIYYEKYSGINLSVSPGISYALNSKWQIETGFNDLLGINYSKLQLEDNSSYIGKRTSAGLNAYTSLNNFSSQIYFGFRLLLQKNKNANSSKG